MQSKGARVGLVAAAAAAAVVAFVALRSADEQDGSPAATGGSQTGAVDSADRDGRAEDSRPDERIFELDVEDGSPAGGVRDLEVARGERVRLLVRADTAEEVHVHGYDLLADVRPGRPAELRFRATLEGVYEIELEGSHTEIARLTVEP